MHANTARKHSAPAADESAPDLAVGARPAGLTVGLVPARAGIESTVVERRPGGARERLGRGRSAVDPGVRARFRDGEADAVRAIYEAYGSLVYAVAFGVLGDRGLCEEAIQETFLRAWRAAASFDASRELGPWLATIARRVAIDLYRREAIRGAGALESVAPDDAALVAPAQSDAVLDVWEVRRAVSELPAEQREVVRLQHFAGLAHDEIAARLKVPVGTVKSRSFRAHRRLALKLGHLRDGNPSPTPAVDGGAGPCLSKVAVGSTTHGTEARLRKRRCADDDHPEQRLRRRDP